MIKTYLDINECEYCCDKATICYLKQNLFGTTIRFLCQECARKQKVIKE